MIFVLLAVRVWNRRLALGLALGLALSLGIAPPTLASSGQGGSCQYTTSGSFIGTYCNGDNPVQTPPTASPTQSPAADASGWNTTDVTVTWNWADYEGIDPNRCTTSSTSSGEGAQTLSATCTDVTGAQGTASYTVNVDKTPPSIGAAPTTQPNAGGWYNAPVTVHFTCADALSGIATCPADRTVSAPGVTASIGGTATDQAGNGASASFGPIQIDTSAPAITPHVSGTPGTSGWYTSSVSVSFLCADEQGGSGLATPSAGYGDTTLTNDGANQSVTSTGSCMDNAGNTADAATASGINIDKTAPTGVTGSLGRPADRNGWYNAPVTVTFSGTDPTSGIASCTSPSYSGPDGANRSVGGSCTDNAGNVGTGSVALNYDATPPTNIVGAPDRAPDRNGWYNHAVAVNFTGTDATSGLPATGACTASATYSGPDSATASVPGTCTDVAGNVGQGSFALKYDATKPTVTYTGNAGTYTADQTVSITCIAADATSGVASTTTCQNITGPAYTFTVGANSYSATAMDLAGNQGTGQTSFTVAVNATAIDAVIANLVTDPSVTATLQQQANAIASAPNAGAKANKLNAFINAVNAQTSKGITQANAATLIKLAQGL